MRIHVIRAVLRVVFQNKDSRVVPVGAIGDSLDDAANCKVIVRQGSRWPRLAGLRAFGVIVGQVHDYQIGERVLAGPAVTLELLELVQELVGAKLVGILDAEHWVERIEVVAQLGLGGEADADHRYGPWIGAGPAARIANIGRDGLSFIYGGARALHSRRQGWTPL